jgi:DNA-binding transcriptional MocR family regulator
MKDGSSVAELVDILRGELVRYSPEEKLPSSRALVERFRVSPVTVSRALAVLAAEGLVVTRPGAGAFRARPAAPPATPRGDTSWQEVALTAETSPDQVPRTVNAAAVTTVLAVPPPGVVELSGGYLPAALRPDAALAAALARAGRRPDAWERSPVEGLSALRAWFARQIDGGAGRIGPDDVIVTPGGQSALSNALRALAPPGAPVLVESPTYPGMLALARAFGLRPVPVPVNAEGVRPELLERAFADSGARVLVCQPLFQNPTGAILTPERRRAVLDIARAAGAFVVEDDFARWLPHQDAGPLPPTLAAEDPHGTVVHVRSLTKIASPSLRIGALAARGPVAERLRATQVVDTLFVPRPLQETAVELVGGPAWPRHLRSVAAALRHRRAALTAGLAAHLAPFLDGAPPAHVPRGGFHLWLPLPPGTDEAALAAAALRAGVAVAPGRPYHAAEPPAPRLRLSFASPAGDAEVTEGVRRLATAWRDLPRRS